MVTKPDLSLTMQLVTPQQQQTDPSKKSILKQMTLVLEFLLLACKINKFELTIYKFIIWNNLTDRRMINHTNLQKVL